MYASSACCVPHSDVFIQYNKAHLNLNLCEALLGEGKIYVLKHVTKIMSLRKEMRERSKLSLLRV